MGNNSSNTGPATAHGFPEWVASDTEVKRSREEITSRLDAVVGQIETLNAEFDEFGRRLTGSNLVKGPEYPWSWSTVVPAGSTRTDPHEVSVEIDYSGSLTSVYIGWTDASNQAVGAQFRGPDDEKLIPRNPQGDADFIAMNDHVLPVEIGFDFEAGSTFTARFVNNDDENDHYINLIGMAEDSNE